MIANLKPCIIIFCILQILIGIILAKQFYSMAQNIKYFIEGFISILLFCWVSYKQPGYPQKHNTTFDEEVVNSEDQYNGLKKNSEILHYCQQCGIVQPLRTKHCKKCKQCILTYDHHCPWLQNCIGQKNKLALVIFLIFQLIQISHHICLLVSIMYQRSDKSQGSINTFCLLLICFAIALSLFVIQLYLICKNLTTWQVQKWERITYLTNCQYKNGSPFNKGFQKNISEFIKASWQNESFSWQF